MVTELVFAPLELLLNHGLQQSARAAAIAAGVEGRALDLHMEGTAWTLRLAIAGGRFRLTEPTAEASDATIHGTLLGLGRLLGADAETAVRQGMVHIDGDAEIAAAFRELLHEARPDFQRELSRLAGDAPARQAVQGLQWLAAWSRRTARDLARQAGEFLTERQRTLVGRAEFEAFAVRVDELVNDVARAEARLQRLAQTGRAAAPEARD